IIGPSIRSMTISVPPARMHRRSQLPGTGCGGLARTPDLLLLPLGSLGGANDQNLWMGWMDSDMQGGPVAELLDMAVERPVLDQLEVEVGRTLEDRVQPGLTGDHREERHLDAVDQTGGHQRPVHRQAA